MRFIKSAEAEKMLADLVFLKGELGGVGERLQLTAAAGGGQRAEGRHAVRRGGKDGAHAAKAIGLSQLCDNHFHAVSDHRVLHKERIAACAAYPLAVFRHIGNGYGDPVVFLQCHLISFRFCGYWNPGTSACPASRWTDYW